MWFNLGLLPFSQLRPPAKREKPVVRERVWSAIPLLTPGTLRHFLPIHMVNPSKVGAHGGKKG